MFDELKTKVLILNQRLWEQNGKWTQVEAWLQNFTGQVAASEIEQLHALYLLTHFLYFGSRQIRELLRALHRDFVLYPIIQEVQARIGASSDSAALMKEVEAELALTRFFGMGNPSESGTHLLYFFRQENSLPKTMFRETHRIFSRSTSNPENRIADLREPGIKRYIFLDDLCGSGHQAAEYSKDLVEDIRRLNTDAKVSYFSLFATVEGLEYVRQNAKFTSVETIYELDQSYKVFSPDSRISGNMPTPLTTDILRRIVECYGTQLCLMPALGIKMGNSCLAFTTIRQITRFPSFGTASQVDLRGSRYSGDTLKCMKNGAQYEHAVDPQSVRDEQSNGFHGPSDLELLGRSRRRKPS